MTLRFLREKVLHQLELAQPGLAPREIIDQSTSFIFDKGKVITFSDEILCSHDCDLRISGAVQAEELLAYLRKEEAEEIEARVDNGKLTFKTARNDRVWFTLEKEVTLAIDEVEKPTKWYPLHEEFNDAVSIVSECAGKDESKFSLTCVHMTSEWIEACDNLRLCRYKLKTGLKTPVLVRGSSIKHIKELGMSHLAQTESWIHFQSKEGLQMSCRKYIEEFPDLSDALQVKGKKMKLPKGLTQAVGKGEIFSKGNADENLLLVQLKPDKVRLIGEGIRGGYQSAPLKTVYKGPEMEFMISPAMLLELTTRHNECYVDEGKLRVNGGAWCFVTVLGIKSEEKEDDQEEESEDEE